MPVRCFSSKDFSSNFLSSPTVLHLRCTTSATESIHLFLGLPADLLPSGFQSIISLNLSPSLILFTCPNHLNWFLSTHSKTGSTPSSLLTSSLLILSLSDTLMSLSLIHISE